MSKRCFIISVQSLMASEKAEIDDENNSWIKLPYKRLAVIRFNIKMRGRSPKVNVKTRPEFDITHYDIVVEPISQYFMGLSSF